jgi:hypothetical protein
MLNLSLTKQGKKLYLIGLFRYVDCGMRVEARPGNAMMMDTMAPGTRPCSPDKFITSKDMLLDW